MSDLLCGHWTFFRLPGDPNVTARCDLPADHEEPLHTFWYGPHETFTWADVAERHEHRVEQEGETVASPEYGSQR